MPADRILVTMKCEAESDRSQSLLQLAVGAIEYRTHLRIAEATCPDFEGAIALYGKFQRLTGAGPRQPKDASQQPRSRIGSAGHIGYAARTQVRSITVHPLNGQRQRVPFGVEQTREEGVA